MNVMEVLSAPCAGDIREEVRRSIRNRVGTVFEVEVRARDGRLLRLETSVDIIRCTDGTIEFRGIAVAQRSNGTSWIRQRCLDERFGFRTLVTREPN